MSESSANLKPNVAGLLCYVGFWVTGIIFLIIERKNKTVRFHAMQSLVVFGILNIIWGIGNTVSGAAWSFYSIYWIAGAISIAAFVIFVIFFAIWWIFWGVLMYKTYHDKLYKVPMGLGNLAEKMIAKLDSSA